MKNIFKTIYDCIRSTILCIRFPFLYPRNIYTGKHYTNWTIQNYINNLYSKYKVSSCKENSYNDIILDKTKVYKLKQVTSSGWCTYYKNWWSYYYIKLIKGFYSFLGIFHIIPTYNKLDSMMPKGWKKSFGIQMCKDIKKALLKKGRKYLKNYRIIDIKEKYGSLYWIDNMSDKNIGKIIKKYEYISSRTCIICGELADIYTPVEYWKCPYCDKHAPNNSKYLIDFGIFPPKVEENGAESWYGWVGNVNLREDYEDRQKKFQEYLNCINY